MIYFKLLMVLGIVGSLYGNYLLIGKNSVLEATLESTTAALGNYATRVEEEIYGYTIAVKVLGERDQKARDKRDEKFSSIEDRNLTKMSKRHPDQLANILTGRTNGMLEAIAKASRSARVSGSSPAK